MIVDGVLTAAQVSAAARRRHRAEVAGWVVLPAWVAFVVSGQRWWVGVVVLASGAVLAALWTPVTLRWGRPSSRERHAEQWRSREFNARQELALRRCADPGEEWRWAVTAAARRRVRAAPLAGVAVLVVPPASVWLLARLHGAGTWAPAGQLAGAVVVIGVWLWIVARLVRGVVDSRRWLTATGRRAGAGRTPDAPTPPPDADRTAASSGTPWVLDQPTASLATVSAPGPANATSDRASPPDPATAAPAGPAQTERTALEQVSVVLGPVRPPGSAAEPSQAPS